MRSVHTGLALTAGTSMRTSGRAFFLGRSLPVCGTTYGRNGASVAEERGSAAPASTGMEPEWTRSHGFHRRPAELDSGARSEWTRRVRVTVVRHDDWPGHATAG